MFIKNFRSASASGLSLRGHRSKIISQEVLNAGILEK